ncbi:MAG TPA: Calx-beta domain-containing protein, partial [Pyrinomonadaceae bacterium]|nr:Calx-beta domain-containing protein [Pyrinomonadaceae bacterium]
SFLPTISADGRVVVFMSEASDLSATADTNNKQDIYARNLATGTTSLVSVNGSGDNSGNDSSSFGGSGPSVSGQSSISDDGRFVVFMSWASNLVANDTNGGSAFGADVFVRDLQAGSTMLVSINSAGTGSGNLDSNNSGRISGNGRFVVFESRATNLVAGMTYAGGSGNTHVFQRDLAGGTTKLVSVDVAGTASGNSSAHDPAVSADGRYVAFTSDANNLAPNDTNGGGGGGMSDVFVRDMQTGVTQLVSVNQAGTDSASGRSVGTVEISADGRFVLFRSGASNLTSIPGFSFQDDLYVRDLQTQRTKLVTITWNGQPGGIRTISTSTRPADTYVLSANGRYASFSSAAVVVQGDSNNVTDVYVFDNDAERPDLMINNVSVTEGNSGTTNMVFTVTLSAPSAQTVTINYATSNSQASSPTDFSAVSGTLTFTPGETVKTITVPVNGDTQIERDEVMFIALTQPVNVFPLKIFGTGTIVNDDTQGALLQFQSTDYSANEGDQTAFVYITRIGSLSGDVSVTFRTVDDPASVRCDDTTNNHGAAYARCDYATTVETVRFPSGDNHPQIVVIPLINDAHVEGNETVQLQLVNAVGAEIGAQSTARLTITDNDLPGAANPIFNNQFFVRQQYLDFLSREPEAGEPWTAVLNNCSDVNNNPACDRLTVSSSFFRSVEFQLKGFFVYRFYSLSFGRLPTYAEIIPDMRSVTGATAEEVYQKRAKYASDFVERQDFRAAYASLSQTDFVNALMGRYNLQSITTFDPATPDGTAKVTLTRADLINRLNAATLTRAQVVRAIVESDEVFNAEFNRAFVAMQYFGYLRRDPEQPGYNNWLNYLNSHPSDFRTMVDGFMNSVEYKLRFGQP